MNYKQKGNLKISKMTLGTVQLGKNYGISNTNGMPSQDQSHNMLTTAARGGVTVLDTSDDYGESEKVIGNYIEQHPEHPFAICTKFSASKKGDKSLYKALKYFAQKSCDALSIRQISFFLSHTEQDYLTYGKELTTALKELKEEGLILNTGISLSRKDCLEEIVDTGAFDAIQMPLSILDNREIQNGMIKKMSDAGIIVFVRSIYLQGLIFQDPQVLRHTKFDAAAPLVEKIQQTAKQEGMSTSQLALSFIRDTEGIDSLVIGSETVDQITENITMFNTPPLSTRVRDNLLSDFSNVDPFIISPWEWKKRT